MANDTINRQDVLDLARKGILVSNSNYKSVVTAIESIPPARDRILEALVLINEKISSTTEKSKREDITPSQKISYKSELVGLYEAAAIVESLYEKGGAQC